MKTAKITMKANDVAEVLVYDQLGRDAFFGDGIGSKEFREQVKAIKAKTINLRINSPGGSVFEAAAMLNALDQHPADILVDVDGLAASAASVLAMAGARRAGDRIRIAANGMLMIHNPHGAVFGGAEEMRRTAELLDKVKGQIVDSYTRRVEDRDQLAAWMTAETWFTGKEAVDAGFADEVTGSVSVAAFAGIDKLAAKLGWKHTPQPPGPTAAELEEHQRRMAVVAKWRG
jgi:ATP-dependent Clp protease protease subunit